MLGCGAYIELMESTTSLHEHAIYHSRRPQASCEFCRKRHESTRYSSSYYCASSGHIFDGASERTNGNGAYAKGQCPTCNRKVGITRPTKMVPWALVGSHRA